MNQSKRTVAMTPKLFYQQLILLIQQANTPNVPHVNRNTRSGAELPASQANLEIGLCLLEGLAIWFEATGLKLERGEDSFNSVLARTIEEIDRKFAAAGSPIKMN